MLPPSTQPMLHYRHTGRQPTVEVRSVKEPREWTPNAIRKLRIVQLRLEQAEFAKRMRVTEKTISSWETGRSTPSLPMQRKLSELISPKERKA